MHSHFIPNITNAFRSLHQLWQRVNNLHQAMKVQPQLLELKTPHKPRKRTSFEENKTASIALSTLPQRHKVPEVKTATPAPSTTGIFSAFTAWIPYFHQHTPPSAQPLKKIPTFVDNVPITTKMASLELEVENLKQQKQSLDAVRLAEVELVWESIIEHAQRRADLFFYMLVAVYGRFLMIDKDDTKKQHGKGTLEYGTNACHSCLFPSVKLTIIPSAWVPPNFSRLFASTPPPLLRNTHFLESLNITVELPRIVNVFDMHLEGKVHNLSNTLRHCTNILRLVSVGEIDPRQGMDEYYRVMNGFFSEFVREGYKNVATDTPNAIKKVWQYQREGTFKGANSEFTAMKEEYLHLLLRLRPEEIRKVRGKPHLLKPFYQKIQEEIFNSPYQPPKRRKQRV